MTVTFIFAKHLQDPVWTTAGLFLVGVESDVIRWTCSKKFVAAYNVHELPPCTWHLMIFLDAGSAAFLALLAWWFLECKTNKEIMLTQQHIHIASTQLYSHAYIHAFIDACICPFNIGNDIMLSKYIHGNGYMHVDAAHKGIHDALHFPYVPPSSHVYLCRFFPPSSGPMYNI